MELALISINVVLTSLLVLILFLLFRALIKLGKSQNNGGADDDNKLSN